LVAICIADQFPGTVFVTGRKFAVIVCVPYIWTEVGFAVVEIAPDQFTNRYPDAAVAVSATVAPASTKPLPETDPPSGGLTFTTN
jgi:hypothetical protein